MKIYTKTGDNGTTGLFAGPRVEKDHPRISAYGTVDELNALLGVAATSLGDATKQIEEGTRQTPTDWIRTIQSDLFSIGAQLATPNPAEQGMCLLRGERIEQLERWIDDLESTLEPLKNFILPGGTPASAMFHLARTVCRRAERELVTLNREPDVQSGELPIVYLNRLSDFLFVLARFCNARAGVPDLSWIRPT